MIIDKRQLLHDLKADLRVSEILKKEWDTKREQWINETYGNPYGNEEEGRSRIVSKDIKKQLEWLIPTITDPFLSSPDVIKCSPVTFEDTAAARQNELILNTQFTRKFNRFNFINKACRVLATEGSAVIQTAWDYEDEEVEQEVEVVKTDRFGNEFIGVTTETVVKIIKNNPTARVCRNEDIFIDPTCMDDMDKCQFIIHRYESDRSTLAADGRFKNVDKIQMEDSSMDPTFIDEDHTNFRFSDTPRKKVLVYEYWGNYDIDGDGIVEPIVCAWVENTIIRLEKNPYPDKKPPFIIVPFNSVPFQMFGEALAENIGDNQKVKTAITRGLIDNMARSNNGQVGMKQGALDLRNRKRFLQGENFEFRGSPADFWQGSFNQLPSSAFDMLTLMNNEIESQTGTKSFSGGITGSALGTTATAARGALDATAVRRLHLVRNLAENLIKPLMRKWMAYNSEFLEEEEVVRITNEQFVPIRRDDLAGNIDIDISISTAEDNSAKAQQLSFLLQTMGPNQGFEINQLLMAEIARLSRMPELEEKIRNHQPQPDPLAEKMKQIEVERAMLENEKIKAEIQDKLARAGENQIDAELKRNKAQVEAAKARKLGSEADKLDLDYLDKDEGFSYSRDMEEKERDRQHQWALAKMQQEAGDKQIGVVR